MTIKKAWWKSKTIWGIALAILTVLFGHLGVEAAELPSWVDEMLELIFMALAAAGRAGAKEQLGTKDEPPLT